MIIKKYIVDDMKEAMDKAKYELGPDAMILSQRYIRQGKWYNPFKKKKLEVTFALERDYLRAKPSKEKLPEKPVQEIREKKEDKRVDLNLDSNFENSIVEDASDGVKKKLESYCELKGLKFQDLSLEEIKEFIEIGFAENSLKKKLEPKNLRILVGPTGVGKTTTIAKLAAKEHLENHKKVGIITIDTYKIGAVDQIEKYADILSLPLEVINKPEEILEAVHRLSYCDIVFIDTLGTSQRNVEKIHHIRDYIEKIQDRANTYLVLSISTDEKTTMSILDKYESLNYDGLILTKFDEVSSFGNLWNIIENSSYPVEYFTYGQEVPEDIKEANLDNLISYSKEIYKYD